MKVVKFALDSSDKIQNLMFYVRCPYPCPCTLTGRASSWSDYSEL